MVLGFHGIWSNRIMNTEEKLRAVNGFGISLHVKWTNNDNYGKIESGQKFWGLIAFKVIKGEKLRKNWFLVLYKIRSSPIYLYICENFVDYGKGGGMPLRRQRAKYLYV